MLANNNVSAGRVVTRMEFDLNYSVPRLLFSPVAAVDTDMLETVRDQGQTQAAQNAIKMNVYKSDKNNVREEEAPQESTPEPVKRAAKSAAPAEKAEAEDVSDILQKWSKK